MVKWESKCTPLKQQNEKRMREKEKERQQKKKKLLQPFEEERKRRGKFIWVQIECEQSKCRN